MLKRLLAKVWGPRPDTDWEHHADVSFRPCRAHNVVMRRRVNGECQYREMTPEEERERVSKDAW